MKVSDWGLFLFTRQPIMVDFACLFFRFLVSSKHVQKPHRLVV